MKKIIFSGLMLFGIFSASAQTKCPTIRVSCPAETKENGNLNYTANVSGGDANVTPTYAWATSAGTITSGQGTSSITVDLAGMGGQTITATVEVGGYERSCSAYASCSTSIITAPKEVKKTVKAKAKPGKVKMKKKA